MLGWQNKEITARLGFTEQAVANHKSFVMTKLKEAAARATERTALNEDEQTGL